MPRRLPSLALAGAALAAAVPPLAAQAAAVPNISVWSGKTKKQQAPVTMYQTETHPGRATFFNLTVKCKIPGGTTTAQTLALHGVAKNGKFTAKTTKALNSGAGAGTLSVATTAVARHNAVGKVSWALPAALGGCKGSDTYSLKYTVSHGG